MPASPHGHLHGDIAEAAGCRPGLRRTTARSCASVAGGVYSKTVSGSPAECQPEQARTTVRAQSAGRPCYRLPFRQR
jgi:hypothetical protein